MLCGVAIAAVCITSTASAQSPVSTDLIDDAFVAEMRAWLQKPVVQISIEAQNRRYKDLSQDKIDALDKQWRKEREEKTQPLVAAILNNPLSMYLTQIQAFSGGLYTEIFVMDANGLNVGQSSVTSDFWQGDEAKFQKTFPIGPEAVFVDEAEFHEGSNTWRAQVNLTVVDENNKPIGAITTEINLTELARRQQFNS
jgi:hypothetical protein